MGKALYPMAPQIGDSLMLFDFQVFMAGIQGEDDSGLLTFTQRGIGSSFNGDNLKKELSRL